jgi:hypothetical protein
MLNTPLLTLLDHQSEHLLLYTLTFHLPSQAKVAGLISDECEDHNNPSTHTIGCPVFLKMGLIFSCNEAGVTKMAVPQDINSWAPPAVTLLLHHEKVGIKKF